MGPESLSFLQGFPVVVLPLSRPRELCSALMRPRLLWIRGLGGPRTADPTPQMKRSVDRSTPGDGDSATPNNDAPFIPNNDAKTASGNDVENSFPGAAALVNPAEDAPVSPCFGALTIPGDDGPAIPSDGAPLSASLSISNEIGPESSSHCCIGTTMPPFCKWMLYSSTSVVIW